MSTNTLGSNLMNNLFDSDLIIGKKTVSYDQTITTNDASDYIVGYNPNDFFYKTVNPTIMPNDCTTNLDWKITDSTQDTICSKTSVTNDDSGKFCYQRELCKNKYFSEKMMEITDKHSNSNIRYLDISTQTNFQAISVANLSIGIALMLYTMFSYW